MMEREKLTWEQIKKSKTQTIFHDEHKDGVRFIVLRGPGTLCAYVGIPIDHPLAGFNYDDIPSIEVHGGLTYSGDILDDGKYYWYGWDYGHCDDYVFYYDSSPLEGKFDHSKKKKWLVEDVVEDSYWGISEFVRLARLAEKMTNKGKHNDH